jgi:hypothetical protein
LGISIYFGFSAESPETLPKPTRINLTVQSRTQV